MHLLTSRNERSFVSDISVDVESLTSVIRIGQHVNHNYLGSAGCQAAGYTSANAARSARQYHLYAREVSKIQQSER